MELLQKILECKDEDVDLIVREVIDACNSNAQQIDRLGFLQQGKSNSIFRGFIPLNARIKYASLNMEDYGMESTDYFYEFANFLRKYKINSKASLIFNLEYFINSYFGMPGKANREEIFNDIAWRTTTTDDEYFESLKNNKLGDLKGKGAAQCTERSALAQQILSFYGTEAYYCMGCVDLEDSQEGHCFNIVKRKNDYALLDYSVPVARYNQDGSLRAYYPFVGTLTNEEFLDFVSNGTIKSFDDYHINGNQIAKTGNRRTYVIGQYEIKKENIERNVK